MNNNSLTTRKTAMKNILSSILGAFTLVTFYISDVCASESVAFFSKAANTFYITGTVNPDIPDFTLISSEPKKIVIENGNTPVDASAMIIAETLSTPDNQNFKAFHLNLLLHGIAVAVGPFLCAKQNGSNHMIKLPEGYTSLDTGDTVFSIESPAGIIDISGLLFEEPSASQMPIIALSANDVKHSLVQSVALRGNKVAAIGEGNDEQEYDLSLIGASKQNLKDFCRELASSAKDVKLNLSVTPEGKVALLLEME